MKTAAIFIDDWKLPIFEKHLKEANYKFTTHPGITAGTTGLRVEYEWVASLKPVVEAAVAECEKVRGA